MLGEGTVLLFGFLRDLQRYREFQSLHLYFLLGREGLVTFSSPDLINVWSVGCKSHRLGPRYAFQLNFFPVMTVRFVFPNSFNLFSDT